MVNRGLLHAVQLNQLVLMVDDGDEVRVTLILHLRLSSNHSLLVMGEDLLAILEEFSPSLRVDGLAVGLESVQI